MLGGNVQTITAGSEILRYGVASRTATGTPTPSNPGTLVYIHADHLGSVSATSSGATGAQQERELAQLRELAVQPLHSGDLDLMQLAQALREPRAIPWREIEQLIGVAQSTLRARLKSTTVAHSLEVAA